MRSDSSILKEIEGLESVYIVGCPACANFSIAYEKDKPAQKLTVDKETGRTSLSPLAVTAETNRLKKIFEDKGMKVGTEIWPVICASTSDGEIQYGGPQWVDPALVNRCSGAEVIVALCCVGGVVGLKKRFGEDCKVIPGMKTEGISYLYTALDKETNLVHIDKARSTIIRSF